ncbi:3-deoxy-D-manno-octulosonic acid transferase [Candidatus Avelusimicrobium luingense]|uniref:3-deoxy-D-manno-octulosonic acid transferase n=1 Tax=Candidatus Avelusimicrobium luingense TaxID=3416211 RepID=UPI003D14C9A9
MGLFVLFLTNLIFPLAALGVLFSFLFSGRRGLLAHLGQELRERFGLEKKDEIIQNAIWLHCASVGEVLSVREVISQLKAFYNRDILITTSTQAGKETALKNPQVKQALLVPLDFYPSCRRFIRLANPYRLFVVEREIWPNLLEAAFQANVPTALINGRISVKSARAYTLIKPLFSRLLKHLSFAALQTPEDAQRYERLGLPHENCHICGNVKYDALNDAPARLAEVDKLISTLGWGGKPIVVLGSTHPQEETMLLRAAPEFIKNNIRLIFAPRHLERMPEIRDTLRQSGISHTFFSDTTPNKNAVLVCADVMGLLPSLYARATLTFVGGSVVPRGAHNLLEPAILSKTVLFGKYFFNTPQTAEALLERGGGILVNEHDFKAVVLRLIADPAQLENMSQKARQTALHFKGATQRIMQVVENYERKYN